MPRFLRSALLLTAALPAGAAAQQTDYRAAIVSAQPTRYEPAACGIKSGHFKVGSGATYLSTATVNAANRSRLLGDAERVLLEAIQDNGQAENAAAWYYLGRVYLLRADVVGADSAFSKAEALAPACKDEILGFRRATALALREPAGLLLQAEKNDSALTVYRLAAVIDPGSATAVMEVGTLFELGNQPDSAIVYFRKAANIGGDDRSSALARQRLASMFAQSDQVDSAAVYYGQMISGAQASGDNDGRNSATMSLAMVFYNAKRYQEAIPLLRAHIGYRPDAGSARQYLAAAYLEIGQVDSADMVLREGGTAAGGAGPDTSSANYFINRGAAHYQANEQAKAAEDFEAALTQEPNNRVALRNLAATYYGLHNAPKLAEVAGRIVALEPLSETARRFQNQGYLWTNQRDQLERLSNELDALPANLEDLKLQVSGANVTLSGTATGRSGKTPAGAAAPATAVALVFEFLDAAGNVVTTVSATLPALQAGVSSPFSVSATGQGITDWRYRIR
jgi:tetratricopeptide (TPR) repeat protein